MAAAKQPRPAHTYRGARRNALKAGERLASHRWQTKPEYYGRDVSRSGTPVLPDGTLDYTFKGPIRANERNLR